MLTRNEHQTRTGTARTGPYPAKGNAVTTASAFTLTAREMGSCRPYWDRLGHPLGTAVTYQEALRLAGLDWGITTSGQSPTITTPITVDTTGATIPSDAVEQVTASIPDRTLVMRADTNVVLGLVGARYTPVDNATAFAITAALAETGARWVSGGALDYGRTCFMLMQPQGSAITITDRDRNTDTIDVMVQIRAGHGGHESMTYAMRGTRRTTSAQVAVHLAHEFPGLDPAISVRHTASANHRVTQANALLARSARYVTGFKQAARRLIDTPLTRTDLLAITEQVWAKPEKETDPTVVALNAAAVTAANHRHELRMERWTARRNQLLALFDQETFAANTAYAAFMAISEYLEWHQTARAADVNERIARRAFNDESLAVRSRVLRKLITYRP